MHAAPLPTLVLVHGSWHKPTCWNKLLDHLEPEYDCVTVALPSTTTDDPNATFKDDLDAARAAIADETSHGHDVVVIAHSYGGMVANSAIKGFTRALPSSSSLPHTATSSNSESSPSASTTVAATGEEPGAEDSGHVIGLILIASGFTLTGLSFMDPFLGQHPPSWKPNWDTGFADLVSPPYDLFYHDLDPDLPENDDKGSQYWVAELGTQSLKALYEGGEHSYAGWKDLPLCWYIGTTEDKGLPVVAQRLGVGMARAMGATVEHREVVSSHSPFLSMPEVTAEIVVEAVDSFVGIRGGERRAVGGGGAAGQEQLSHGSSTGAARERKHGALVGLPSAMLWKPATWFRFGVPLLFGHLIGNGILAYGWLSRNGALGYGWMSTKWRSWRSG